MRARTQYLLFIDESGSHGMVNIDPKWPLFVLVGLLVGEKYYKRTLVPRVTALKIKHGLGTDVVLHSRDIRRQEGDFQFLRDSVRRMVFYEDLNSLMIESRFRLYAVVVDKLRLKRKFLTDMNPYDMSLRQLLSLVCGPPDAVGANRPAVSRIIAESRGRVEDKELQHEFQSCRRVGLASYGTPGVQRRRPSTVARFFPDRVTFARKSRVIAGLELADLAAYPIGRASLNEDWDHPAYQIVARRLRAIVPSP